MIILIIIAFMFLAFYGFLFYKARNYFLVSKIKAVTELSSYVDPSLELLGRLKDFLEKSDTRNAEVAKKLMASLEQIPIKTLNTIQGSVNTTTGKLGELMKFIELQRAYDRIFPVGDIIDFIGVRFPKGEDRGAIDLIEIKTGDKAVLNPDQKKLREMIINSKDSINFKIVKVEIT